MTREQKQMHNESVLNNRFDGKRANRKVKGQRLGLKAKSCSDGVDKILKLLARCNPSQITSDEYPSGTTGEIVIEAKDNAYEK